VISFVFAIAVVLILLPTIASASPPDPLWVAGIYDGADGDDIVSLVDDTTGVEAVSRPSVPPLSFSYGPLFPSGPGIVCDLVVGEFNRGPPLSTVLSFDSLRYACPASPVSPPHGSFSRPSRPVRAPE